MPRTLIFAAGAAGILLVCCALFGWGRLVRRVAGLPQGSWPVSATLGLASWIFFGGVLNLCHLAYPWALDLLVFVGLGLAAVEWRTAGFRQLIAAGWPTDPAERRYRLGFYVVVLAIMGFTVVTQLSSQLYNPGDDFRKYFAHAVRMVQTGTLRGSPLNALGSETLGGQTFLQGFIVGHFPIQLINGADAVFCFGLCLLLAGGVALERPALGGAAITGVLAILLIHPQYVNVSSLYSTAALLMGLALLTVDPREHSTADSNSRLREMPAALLYAGVVALKPTGSLFLALQFIFLVAASAWAAQDWHSSLKSARWIVIWSVLFILPWLLLYAPEYFMGLVHPMTAPSMPVPTAHEKINLLSPAQQFYGGSFLAYTGVAIGLGLYALAGCLVGVRRAETSQRGIALKLAAVCAAAAATYLLINVVGLYFAETSGTLRYSIPILIGATPAALGLGALCWDDRTRPGGGRRGTWLALTFGAVLAVLSFPAVVIRFELLFNHGTQLAYLQHCDEQEISKQQSFAEFVFHGPLAREIGHLQRKIPPGEKMVAWIETPFYLDYARNPIVDVNESGLGASWSVMPDVDYVLWQYQGGGVPTRQQYLDHLLVFGRRMGFVMARTLDFYQSLDRLAAQAEILADEDGFRVMRLKHRPNN